MTTLPDNIEAEEGLISVCLVDCAGELPKCLAAGISPLTFSQSANATLFAELMELHAKGISADAETLLSRLTESRQIEAIGGQAAFFRIALLAPTTVQAAYFRDQVLSTHARRKLMLGAMAITEAASNTANDLAADVLPLVGKLSALSVGRQETRTWEQAVDEALALTRERMKPLADRNLGAAELSWNLGDFDKYFQPIEPGELIVVGGYTSSGKSSLLRQVLWGMARAGHPTLLETIEVRDAEEAVNLAGHISGVRSRAFLDLLAEREKQDLLDAFPTMRVPHFSVVHQDHNLAAMLGRARAFKAKHGLRVLGVDYLQIMEDVKRLRPGERPDFAIGVVTSELKRFATAEGVAVFLLSGFNRQYISDGNREPVLSDLDGSSSIEKDASRVLLIDVPKTYRLDGMEHEQDLTENSDSCPRFFVKVVQAKGRNQGTSGLGMFFRRETKTFIPIQK